MDQRSGDIDRAVLQPQSAPHTGAHLMQPCSEAYEAEDRCFRVAVARRLMLPHPAVAGPSGVALTCTNKSATEPNLWQTGGHTSSGQMSCGRDTLTQWHQGVHRTGGPSPY